MKFLFVSGARVTNKISSVACSSSEMATNLT